MKKVLWSKKELEDALNYKDINYFSDVTGASIDTRTIKKGDMFFALSGENFNGNEFIDIAFQKGASLCFTDDIEKVSQANRNKVIRVDEVAKVLNTLAKYRRQSINGKVIGITGSVGKTSTKEMLKIALSNCGKTFASTKNFNNHYGLPLSIINCPRDVDFCVLELGMSNKGEILNLTKIAKPNISIITNIHPVHLEFFASTEDIAYAKSEIFENMQQPRFAILNEKSLHFNVQFNQAKKFGLEIFTFGKFAESNCYIKDIIDDKGIKRVKIRYFNQDFEQSFDKSVGDHLIYNSLAIFICESVLNVDLTKVQNALINFKPQSGRGELIELSGHIKLIDESYNSSPEALTSAIKNAVSFRQSNIRVLAILGDMKELGAKEAEFHKNINIDGIDKVFCVGKLMKNLYDNAAIEVKGAYEENSEEMSKIINDYIKENDIILVKGSLSMQMKSIVDSIKNKWTK
jgi:UDP-N-acetylmuramoyl-tripeptide--D-alanyl-D-alanine ligase